MLPQQKMLAGTETGSGARRISRFRLHQNNTATTSPCSTEMTGLVVRDSRRVAQPSGAGLDRFTSSLCHRDFGRPNRTARRFKLAAPPIRLPAGHAAAQPVNRKSNSASTYPPRAFDTGDVRILEIL